MHPSTQKHGVIEVADAGHVIRPPLLRLQQDISLANSYPSEDATPGKRQRDSGSDEWDGESRNAVRRISVHPSVLARLSQACQSADVSSKPESKAEAKPLATVMEDAGVFEDRSEPEQLPSFTVAKPGLKSKRNTGKVKGVVSSVLGADGSIRLEQSRML
jgi:hypothetical protein